MNTKNLNLICKNYISKFEYINTPVEPDENYKWRAVKSFQEIFDIDAPDFASMLKKARESTKNLIDNYMQPFNGLVVMASKNGEAETIREMFRRLYAPDGGDLSVRQAKIDVFLKSCDELLKKHYPSSHLYINDQRSAMAYLWFHDPDNNYLCKNTEAQYLANAVEFYDDWGTYANFHLSVYYRFCDALIEEIRKNPDLMSTHQSRFDGHEKVMYPDKNLHILVFDIIYCARTYGLYANVKIKEHSAEDKRLYQQRKEKAVDLAAKLAEAEENLLLLQEGREKAEAWIGSGATLRHKNFGEGTLINYNGNCIDVLFSGNNVEMKFGLMEALGNGFITLEVPDFPMFIEKYGPVFRQAGEIPQRVKSAQSALEPYLSFLD